MKRSRYAAVLALIALAPVAARAAAGDVSGGFIRFSDGLEDDTFTIGVERVDIGIVDADQNNSPTIREFSDTFLVRSVRGDSVIVRLQEVLPNGGFFRIVEVDGVSRSFIILSDTVGLIAGDGVLFVGHNDTITIDSYVSNAADGDTFFDTAVAVVAPSTGVLTFVTDTAGATTQPAFYETFEGQAGYNDTIFVRLVDPDANRDPQAQDTVLVAVENLNTSDSEHLILLETSDTSGIFIGAASTASETLTAQEGAGGADNDGILHVVILPGTPDNTITVTYLDTLNGDFAQDTTLVVRPVGAVATFLTASGDTEADSGAIPQRVYPEVIDFSANGDPSAIETVAVTVTSTLTGDTETLVLPERGLDFGVFFYDSGLVLSDTVDARNPSDNILLTAVNDTLTVLYEDVENSQDTATDTVVVIRLAETAVVRFTGDTFHSSVLPETVAVGETVALWVSDGDRNDSPLARDTVVVRLSVPATGDFETVVLTEAFDGGGASDTSGIFLSAGFDIWVSDTAGAVANDSILFAASGDTIELSYDDSGTTRIDSLAVVRFPSAASIAIVDASTLLPAETLPVRGTGGGGTPLRIRVTDPDENTDVSIQDTLFVTVVAGGTGDTVRVLLVETGTTSGVFENLTDTIYLSDTTGLAPAETSLLLIRVGDTISAAYTDPDDGTDSALDTATVVAWDSRPSVARLAEGGFSAFPETYAVSDSGVEIEVRDLNRNHAPASRDTVAVVLSVPRTGDSVTLILTETADTSGVFRSGETLTLSDTTGLAASETAILFAGVGDTLRLVYVDGDLAADSSFDSASVTRNAAAGTVGLFLDTPPTTVASAYGPDSTVYIRLFDPNANLDVLLAETATVVLRSFATADTLSVVLRETAAASGVFVGEATVSDTVFPDAFDSVLSVAAKDSITVRWSDPVFAEVVEDTAAIATPNLAGAISLTVETPAKAPPASVVHGDSLFVRVFDRERNTSPAVRDSVTVTVVSRTMSGDTVDSVTITLLEVDAADSATADSGSGGFSNADTPILLSITDSPVSGDTVLSIPTDSGVVLVRLSTAAPDTASDSLTTRGPGATAVLSLVDSAFVSAGTFRIGDSVHVTLVDSDLNRHPGVRDTVLLTLQGAVDSATVLLIETTETSGVFTSATDSTLLSLFTGAGTDVLRVGVGESFTVTIFDTEGSGAFVSDSALVLASGVPPDTLAAIDTDGGRSDTVLLGDTLTFEAFAPNDSNALDAADTLEVRLLVSGTGDAETLVLTENGTATFLFRSAAGILVTAETAPGAGDGFLSAAAGDTILATLATPAGNTTAIVTVETRDLPGTAAFLDTGGVPVVSLPIGSAFVPRIIDTGLNTDPAKRETFTVTITTMTNNDSAVGVVFTETSSTSGVFLGETVTLVRNDTNGANRNLGVRGGDTVFLFFDGNTVALSVLAETSLSVLTVETGDVVSDGRFGPGDTITARVEDSDENVDPFSAETVTVTFAARFDTVTLVLTEDSTSSVNFSNAAGVRIRLRTTATPDTGDTFLEVVAGESISVSYTDADDPQDTAGGPQRFEIFPNPAASAGTISLTAGLQVQADSVFLGETVYAFIFDTGADVDQSRRDTVLAVMSALGTGDSTTLLLTETGDSTGLFAHETGVFVDSALLPVNADATIEAFFGDTIRLAYTDPFFPSDSSQIDLGVRPLASKSSVFSITVSNSAGGAPLATFVIGDTIFVSIQLASAAGFNFDPNVTDTFTLSVFSIVTGDTETMVLTESNNASLFFTNDTPSGNLPGPVGTKLTDGSVTQNDGVLELSAVGRSAFGGAAFRAQATSDGDIIEGASEDLPGLDFPALGVVGAAITSAENIVVYPNPYRPNDGDPMTGSNFVSGNFRTGILFGRMPSTWRLRIYTIDGRLVAERTSEIEAARGRIQGGVLYQYDARNDAGQEISSGIYLYVVESNVGTKTGKFAVIR